MFIDSPTALERKDSFGQTCPRCGTVLHDRTAIEEDRKMLFWRVRFECPACSFWLCTRLENFSVLGPVPNEGDPPPAYLSRADQQIRLDLTQMVVTQLMPSGVESYEAGRVWKSGKGTVTKSWSEFKVCGLHLCLAKLAQGYLQERNSELCTRALELATAALRSAGAEDPSLSADDPENRRNAARILAQLGSLYQMQGREDDAQALLAEAKGWAPEIFDSEKSLQM